MSALKEDLPAQELVPLKPAEDGTVSNMSANFSTRIQAIREDPSMYFPEFSANDEEAVSDHQTDTKEQVEKSLNRYERANEIFEARMQILIQQYWNGDLSVKDIVKYEAVKRIASLPEKQRSQRIQQGMNDIGIATEAIKQIRHAPKDDRLDLIKQGLNVGIVLHPDSDTLSIKQIQYLPEQQRSAALKFAINLVSQKKFANYAFQETALSQIQYIPENERHKFVLWSIQSNPDLALKYLSFFSEEEQLICIQQALQVALNMNNNFILHNALKELLKLSENQQESCLRAASKNKKKLRNTRLFGLNPFYKNPEDTYVQVRAQLQEKIEFAKRQRVIVNSVPLPVLTENLSSIPCPRFGNSIPNSNTPLSEISIATPLYNKAPKRFLRHPFEKDHSETTLLGERLEGKLIVRHIRLQAFLAWKAAFEAHETWKEQGFSYVPVEPIVDFRLSKDGNTVDVVTEVLDLNLYKWLSQTDLWAQELQAHRTAIIKVLESKSYLTIHHGDCHTNYANCCLRFEKDENGNPDFSKCPKLYLIDFDRAYFAITD